MTDMHPLTSRFGQPMPQDDSYVHGYARSGQADSENERTPQGRHPTPPLAITARYYIAIAAVCAAHLYW